MTSVSKLLAYEVDPVYGCHLWSGELGSSGRPIIWRGRRPSSAYRLAFEAAGGVVPDGQVLDHLCRRVLCINVAHLEPVTQAENERRKSWAWRCKRKRCARGHDLSDALVTPEGGRLCRTCRLAEHGELCAKQAESATPGPDSVKHGAHTAIPFSEQPVASDHPQSNPGGMPSIGSAPDALAGDG